MVPGVLVHVGAGAESNDNHRFLLVPALTLRQLKNHRKGLETVKELLKTGSWIELSDDELDRMAEVMMLSVGRNHPTLTAPGLIDLLDIHSAIVVLAAILGQGKVVTPTPEEEDYLSDRGTLEINPLYTRPLQS